MFNVIFNVQYILYTFVNSFSNRIHFQEEKKALLYIVQENTDKSIVTSLLRTSSARMNYVHIQFASILT